MLEREGYEYAEDTALIGDESAVAARIEELRAAGVDEFVAHPIGGDEETLARTRAPLRQIGSS